MSDYEFIIVDEPAQYVQRITLNRPDKRNAMNNALRGEVFDALLKGDQNPDIRVSIIRGAGKAFCSGYDLGGGNHMEQPYYTPGGIGNWPRHVVQGWFSIWDLAKPVIAQVHGYCLAGGTELATACDLVYVAEDVQIGYPPVRTMSPPDMQFHPWMLGMRHAMELMLTGDSMNGEEAVSYGFANRCYAADELDDRVLEHAERVAKVASDVQQMNKRSIHRAMEIMGMRAAIQAGTEIQALAFFTETSQTYRAELRQGVSAALTKRDKVFGDYRTTEDKD
jgi:enoyl-CoA hydratase